MGERANSAERPAPATAGFSLLLPVYAGDSPEFLRLAFVSSVQEQELCPAEVVIVRDGPVSAALAAELISLREESPVPVQIVELAVNQGLTAALNAGLAACSYPVIARMDADDVSEPARFKKQWELLQQGYDLVGSGMVEFADDPAVTGTVRVPPVGDTRIREHARTHNPFNHPTMLYRREALARVGDYKEFGRMEDYWLGIRLLRSGARCANIPEPLVRYRVGAGAFVRRGGLREARTEWRLQREMLRIGFISVPQYVRNVVFKGAYRLLPAGVKQFLYARILGKGLPGDRGAQRKQDV